MILSAVFLNKFLYIVNKFFAHCSRPANDNWYYFHGFHASKFFQFDTEVGIFLDLLTIFTLSDIDTSISFNDFSFLSTITISGLLLATCLSVWMLKSHNTLKTSFLMTGKGSWLYHATEVSPRGGKEGRENSLVNVACYIVMLH